MISFSKEKWKLTFEKKKTVVENHFLKKIFSLANSFTKADIYPGLLRGAKVICPRYYQQVQKPLVRCG